MITLGSPFGIDLFDYVRKLRKCAKSDEYNANPGSEPSKTSLFSHRCFIRFSCFFRTPSRDHSEVSKRQPILKNKFLDRSSIFQGSENQSLGLRFRAKNISVLAATLLFPKP